MVCNITPMNIDMFLNLLHKYKPNIGNKLLCQPYECSGFESNIYVNNVELFILIFPLQFRDDILTMVKLCGCNTYREKFINMPYGRSSHVTDETLTKVELIIKL